MNITDMDIKVVIDDETGRASVSSGGKHEMSDDSPGSLIAALYALFVCETERHRRTEILLRTTETMEMLLRREAQAITSTAVRRTRRKDALLRRILHDGTLNAHHEDAIKRELGIL